jgi:hypothetical protein
MMMSRRLLLSGAAALPFAAAGAARGAAPMLGATQAKAHRFALGNMEVRRF